MAWPHVDTDWAPMLGEVQQCYERIARAICATERLLVVAPNTDDITLELLTHDRLATACIPTNDTWTRDYGPICVEQDGTMVPLDFTFNGWGMKFAANHDNLVNEHLDFRGIFAHSMSSQRDMVLEGGSIESDGRGTLLTTTSCLLSHNRNPFWTKDEIERQLCRRLGSKKVLWLSEGYIPGDDTDGHIDTLARLAPGNVILHATAQPGQEEYDSLRRMAEELSSMTNAQGEAFTHVPLPAPDTILDEDGMRLPATYANYLVLNGQVLVPTYGQPDNDKAAIDIIAQVFTDRKVSGIDCRALIQQHGSLHCATMQLPQGSTHLSKL